MVRQWGEWEDIAPAEAAADPPEVGGEESPLKDLVLPEHSAIMKLLERHTTPLDTTRPPAAAAQSAEYLSKIIEQQAAELAKYRYRGGSWNYGEKG